MFDSFEVRGVFADVGEVEVHDHPVDDGSEFGDALVVLSRDFEREVDELAVQVLYEFEDPLIDFEPRIIPRVLDQNFVKEYLVLVLVHLDGLVLSFPFPIRLGLPGFVIVYDGLAARGYHLVYLACEVRVLDDDALRVEIELGMVLGLEAFELLLEEHRQHVVSAL